VAQENSALIRRWFEEVWNQGRAEAIDEMLHPQAKGYGQAEHGRQIDKSEFRALWRSLRKAFPDIKVTIHETVSENDRVVARWSATMTHKGKFMSFARAGRSATISGMSMQRMESGKIIEGWDNWDQPGLLVQIGAAPLNKFV
jgi:steroid delta-isomerase-like uncharacterized protein